MFELKNHEAKVASFNPRCEKHGQENVMAGDLKVECTGHSSLLDHFVHGQAGHDVQLVAGEILVPTQRRQARQLALGQVVVAERKIGLLARCRLAIQRLAKALVEVIELDDVELSSFVFEALDGGSVSITFRASFHPDGRTSGKLCQLIQETVEITLIAPEAGQQQLAA